jgi:hypothetical protein
LSQKVSSEQGGAIIKVDRKTIIDEYCRLYSVRADGKVDTFDTHLHFSQHDVDMVLEALDEQRIADLGIFKQSLEALTNNMQDFTFISEWKANLINESDFLEKCSNSITWHLLLQSLNPRHNPAVLTWMSVDENTPQFELLAFRQALYGSMIMQLYVALIHNREILARIVKTISSKSETIRQLEILLSCDYVRHMRNSLAHGDYLIFSGGVIFNDQKNSVAAPSSLIEDLSTWLNLIMLQVM